MTSPRPLRRQRGVTLIELMVALTIGLFITLAACAALIVSRQGFTAVDAGGQLRENARFTADLLQRIVVQAGFDDIASGYIDRDPNSGVWPNDAKWPGIQGFDDAFYTGGNPSAVTNGSRSGGLGSCGSTDTACANWADVLVVRFGGSSAALNSTTPDGAIINCAGIGEPHMAPDGTANSRAFSVFHLIRTGDGEPALMCSYLDRTQSPPAWNQVTLVKGVEDFQVLYGTDGVTPNTAPPAGSTGMHGTVDRYLTAKELVVSGNATATMNNWRRVRALRIGLLFRGDVGSMSTRTALTMQMRDFDGSTFQSTGSAADPNGNSLAVPADGRLRQTMIFTVHLRNQQGYDVCTLPSSPC